MSRSLYLFMFVYRNASIKFLQIYAPFQKASIRGVDSKRGRLKEAFHVIPNEDACG